MKKSTKQFLVYSGPGVLGIYIGQSKIWELPFRYVILSILVCVYISGHEILFGKIRLDQIFIYRRCPNSWSYF
jgi:hypothetical protein